MLKCPLRTSVLNRWRLKALPVDGYSQACLWYEVETLQNQGSPHRRYVQTDFLAHRFVTMSSSSASNSCGRQCYISPVMQSCRTRDVSILLPYIRLHIVAFWHKACFKFNASSYIRYDIDWQHTVRPSVHPSAGHVIPLCESELQIWRSSAWWYCVGRCSVFFVRNVCSNSLQHASKTIRAITWSIRNFLQVRKENIFCFLSYDFSQSGR